MVELPKRGRGRPSKADIEARQAALKNQEKSQDSVDAEFLDSVTAEHTKRREAIAPTEEVLRTIFQLAKIMCNQREIASVLGIGERYLRDFMTRHPEARAAWEDGTEVAKISLRRKQFAQADKSAPMAIFLGKNYLGQRDEHHSTTTINKPAEQLTEAQLMELAERGSTSKKSSDKPASLN